MPEWGAGSSGSVCRIFEGEERHIEEGFIKVWTHGIQHDDGRIDSGPVDAPSISVDGLSWEEGISSETARRVADLLVMAADEIGIALSRRVPAAYLQRNLDPHRWRWD